MSGGIDEYLFEKVFFQAAHISILDVALRQAREDIIELGKQHDINVQDALMKIKVAFSSVDKLQKGKPDFER